MFAYALWTRTPLDIGRRGQAFALVFGVAQFVLNFNFVYRAEAHIASGLVAVLFALLLVPNAVFGRIFLKQPLSPRFLLGSLVAVAGVGLLILRELRADGSSEAETLLGAGLTIAGLLCASAANIMQGTARGKALPMASTLAWGMAWGTGLDAIGAWVQAGPPVIDPSPVYLGGVLYLGIFASAIAFTCYFNVIRAVGPARAAYSGVLVPIIAMTISTLFEGYRWTPLAVAGGVTTMAGLLIALSARRPVAKPG